VICVLGQYKNIEKKGLWRKMQTATPNLVCHDKTRSETISSFYVIDILYSIYQMPFRCFGKKDGLPFFPSFTISS
jgi:hypothetical protein